MKSHMCMDIAGAIRNKAFKGFEHEGMTLTSRQAEDRLRYMLAMGHKVLLMSKDCDNFDNQKGCLGHPDDPQPTETKVSVEDVTTTP